MSLKPSQHGQNGAPGLSAQAPFVGGRLEQRARATALTDILLLPWNGTS